MSVFYLLSEWMKSVRIYSVLSSFMSVKLQKEGGVLSNFWQVVFRFYDFFSRVEGFETKQLNRTSVRS